MSGTLQPGLADPVHDGQRIFRAVLDAMARPGRIATVDAPAAPPAPLGRAAAAVLLALADAETPVWLDPAAASAADWLLFHTGARLAEPERARFAVALGAADLGRFDAGSDEEPERSATLILQVDALGEGARFGLRGPGLAGRAELAVIGLPDGFLVAWAANRARFPRGVDAILCAGDRLAALPRTVAMEAG